MMGAARIRFLKHRPAVWGLGVLLFFILLSTFVPWLANYDALKTNLEEIRQPPSLHHLFGTDEIGRDVFVRLWAGGRISLWVGMTIMLAATALGVLVGAVAALRRGWVDQLLMRFTDLMLSIPQLLVLLLMAQMLRRFDLAGGSSGIIPIILTLCAFSWMGTARLMRAQILAIVPQLYIEAAQVTGVPTGRLFWRHILPNALSPLVVSATLKIGSAILLESTLSFLGFGIQPPMSTWGNMLKNAQSQMVVAPWLALFPGLAIFLTVLSINHIGDGLRDALDPWGQK